jgi:glycosyltransferase involved in cell wall biosynthesis
VTTSPTRRRIAVLCRDSQRVVDGIRDYSWLLVQALQQSGRFEATLLVRFGVSEPLSGYDAVVLQYNPFLYGRWGVAPWLPLMLAQTRRATPRPIIAVMVHEPYVPMVDARSALMGLYQRLQLASLRRSADVLFSSIESWIPQLGGRVAKRPCFHLPVASTLPDRRNFRRQERERLAVDGETCVLAAFGTAHPSRLTQYIVNAANAVGRSGRRVVILNLGAGASDLGPLDRSVKVVAPGTLAADLLARRLAAADIFLAPFVDGVSTRRTTLMAALQHGIAVVGTDGALTDGVLRRARGAVCLVPAGEPERFAETVVQLATDGEQRLALGEQGSRLYTQLFDWPRLTTRLVDALGLQSAENVGAVAPGLKERAYR